MILISVQCDYCDRVEALATGESGGIPAATSKLIDRAYENGWKFLDKNGDPVSRESFKADGEYTAFCYEHAKGGYYNPVTGDHGWHEPLDT